MNRRCEDDAVKAFFFKHTRFNISVYKMEIRYMLEHPCCLLYLGKIDVSPYHFTTGDDRKPVGQPAVSASYLQFYIHLC